MTEIVPRFEFRAFASDLGNVETAMRRYSAVSKYRESLEIYIMSAGNDDNNTKIRSDLMDIKELMGSEQDLEQWSPRMKVEFPLAVETLRDEVFPAFGVATPDFDRGQYTLHQYLNEIIQPHPDLAAVSVFKRRYGFEIQGCIAEIADVQINGAAIRTACLESPDVDAIQKARAAIQMDDYENVNYLLAIKRVIGMAPLPKGAFYRAF
ncbi:MAG: hypothetical protein GY731_17295 [Gammaproteobacteria bacterium]|nr:hypothetical protein [Gammaproteobacteria bacterium]